MPCDVSKDVFPDLQTAIIVRNEMISRYGIPFLAYKCIGGCSKWHLTTHRHTGLRIKRWNQIDTIKGANDYWALVVLSNPTSDRAFRRKETIRVSEVYL